jgi:hypothetical protein
MIEKSRKLKVNLLGKYWAIVLLVSLKSTQRVAFYGDD